MSRGGPHPEQGHWRASASQSPQTHPSPHTLSLALTHTHAHSHTSPANHPLLLGGKSSLQPGRAHPTSAACEPPGPSPCSSHTSRLSSCRCPCLQDSPLPAARPSPALPSTHPGPSQVKRPCRAYETPLAFFPAAELTTGWEDWAEPHVPGHHCHHHHRPGRAAHSGPTETRAANPGGVSLRRHRSGDIADRDTVSSQMRHSHYGS